MKTNIENNVEHHEKKCQQDYKKEALKLYIPFNFILFGNFEIKKNFV